MMLIIIDYFLTALHLFVTFFNLFGWIPKRTRKIHRWFVLATLGCWLVVGAMVGTIGFCPLTEWHWRVKHMRGEENLPHSFITYMLNEIGLFPDPALVDKAVGLTFAVIVVITAGFWAREIFLRKRNNPTPRA